ncbi:MAG TPA: SIS domain-containing protein [Actinomycetes bacterium]|nr:SIS domain-containing protein [Actinomycetes bacterium]
MAQAGARAQACHDMAQRFHRGGKLIVFGNGGGATDAQHLSVEFVHPVIVGKRALPALSLTSDVATVTGLAREDGFRESFAHQVELLAEPADIALGLSPDGRCENVARAFATAHRLGLLTIALSGGTGGLFEGSADVDHLVVTGTEDPRIVKEMHVTAYHVLWELVHVFLEQPGVLGPEVIR